MWGSLWSFDFTYRKLLAGQLPLRSTDVFYPVGRDLYADAGANYLDALLAFPLRLVFGYPGFWNPWIALVVLGNFGAGWWAARLLGMDPAARCVAGLLTALNPHTLYNLEAGRPTQALLWPYPLAMALLARRGPRPWRDALLAGLATSVAGYLYWFGGMLLGMGCLLLLLARPARRFLPYALGLLPVLPAVVPLAWAYAHGGLSGVTWNQPLPGRYELPAGDPRTIIYAQSLGPARHRDSLGLNDLAARPARPLAAGLALGSLVQGPGPLWAPALLGCVLALGPSLPVARTELPLPYRAFYRWVPFFSRFLFPERALCLVAPALALLAGLSLQAAGGWLRGAYLPVACALLGILTLEALPGGRPLSTIPLPTSPYLEELRATSSAILDLPLESGKLGTALQPLHGRPTVFGMGSAARFLWPAQFQEMVTSNPFLAELVALDQGWPGPLGYYPEAVGKLRRLGVDRVLVWRLCGGPGGKLYLNPLAEYMAHELARVLGPPVFTDEVVWVFALPPPPGAPP